MTRIASLLLVTLLFAGGCGRLGFASEASTGDLDAGMDARVDGGADIGSGSVSTCGDGVVDGDELCDDGNRTSGDGCAADCDEREACGDGVVSTGEVCDDGNGLEGDGCDNDCTPSCQRDDECDDGQLCNGTEACGPDAACIAGAAEADGVDCGSGRICRAGSCASPLCGNATPDAGEDCDDGNRDDGDGCDNDCTFSCAADIDCDDANECTADVCADENFCVPPDPAIDGAVCDRDMDLDTSDICRDGNCLPSVCGDNFVDPATGEQCDDGNVRNGDGCDNDCTFSCENDDQCDDGEPCNGTEVCGDNVCRRGTGLSDGAVCNVTGRCAMGRCLMIFDGGASDTGSSDTGFVDTGTPDTGATSDGGTCPDVPTWDMPLQCYKACTIAADCELVQESCCCGCTQGGSETAINSAYTTLWNQRQFNLCGSCRGRLCMDVIGNCPTGVICNGSGLCEPTGGMAF